MQTAELYSASLKLEEEEISALKKALSGLIDLHVHLAPDIVKRALTDVEFANSASKVGYKGLIIKDHHGISASRGHILRGIFPKLEAHGGIVLNHPVGGLNPDAVEVAIKLGAKQVWMPTLGAAHHYKYFGSFALPGTVYVRDVRRQRQTAEPLTILEKNSKLKPEVIEILQMIADANVILGTGHLSLEEILVLVEKASAIGIKKMLITHPEFKATNWSASAQRRLAEKGAILEHCANMDYDAKLTAQNIKLVGAEYCVLSSDSGQVKKGHPAHVMKKFIEDLMSEGISESEIWTMTRENPSKLLGLE